MRPGTLRGALGALLRRLVRQARRRVAGRDSGPGLSYVRPEPYGVIAAIPPWNGSMMGMGQKVAPALAAGNSVVVKAPELAPFGMLRFAELALEAGLPRGVLNVVVGDARCRRGARAPRRRRQDHVHRRYRDGAGASWPRPPSTSRRSCSNWAASRPTSSFPDADLDAAASMAAMLGVGLLSGQGCALPTRLYVHDDVYDAVATKVVAARRSARGRRSRSTRGARRPGRDRTGARTDPRRHRRGARATAPSSVRRRSRSAASSPPGTSSHRPCSATSNTAATWRAMKSSARFSRCCASPTKTKSSPRRTTARSAWPPTCTHATLHASNASPTNSKRAR